MKAERVPELPRVFGPISEMDPAQTRILAAVILADGGVNGDREVFVSDETLANAGAFDVVAIRHCDAGFTLYARPKVQP